MPNKGINRAGMFYGVMYVECEDPNNRLNWRVHCTACRTVQILTSKQCSELARRPSARCRHCAKPKPGVVVIPAKPPAPKEAVPDPLGITIPGMGLYPFINGKMGPRQ